MFFSFRRLKEEEGSRALSLPSIPNPFPELCSPSNSPILSNSSLGPGSQREGVSHVSVFHLYLGRGRESRPGSNLMQGSLKVMLFRPRGHTGTYEINEKMKSVFLCKHLRLKVRACIKVRAFRLKPLGLVTGLSGFKRHCAQLGELSLLHILR